MKTQSLDNPIRRALSFGQSIWFDGLVAPGEFARMIREDGLRGATTNPTIFEKALSGGSDPEAAELLKRFPPEEAYQRMAIKAVGALADLFLDVYKETRGADGYVSIEVDPHLAHDTSGTVRQARELHACLKRPNVMIKIPATPAGIPAVEAVIADGIPVNVTLIFSVERYREVIEAYLAGLTRRAALGAPLEPVASVASFFVSRVDTAVDKLLAEKGDPAKPLAGRAGIANSKIAYQEFRKSFSTGRFQKLAAAGARLQRPLWASTGTKNPAYSDVLYAEELMGADTVNTLPPATYAAFRDHGRTGAPVEQDHRGALETLEALRRLGIDMAAVTARLEEQGVKLFTDSHNLLLQGLAVKKNA